MAAPVDRLSSPQCEFEEQLQIIEKVICRVAKSLRKETDREEFAQFARCQLHERAVLGKFKGSSKLSTYLTVAISRLLIDFRRRHWGGKFRPSAEARRLGPVAVLLERLLVRDRVSFEEACETVLTDHDFGTSRRELEALAGRLPVRLPRQQQSDQALVGIPAPDTADAPLLEEEARADMTQILAVLNDVLADLAPKDRAVLVYRFTDGMKIAEIARIVHLGPKQAYKKVGSLLRGLRDALEARGIDASRVIGALED